MALMGLLTNAQRLCMLLEFAEDLAEKTSDGHLTIMRFTTGWKVMLHTPEVTIEFQPDGDIGSGGGWGEINKLKKFKSLEQALADLVEIDIN